MPIPTSIPNGNNQRTTTAKLEKHLEEAEAELKSGMASRPFDSADEFLADLAGSEPLLDKPAAGC